MNGQMRGRVGMEALAALLLDWNCLQWLPRSW